MSSRPPIVRGQLTEYRRDLKQFSSLIDLANRDYREILNPVFALRATPGRQVQDDDIVFYIS